MYALHCCCFYCCSFCYKQDFKKLYAGDFYDFYVLYHFYVPIAYSEKNGVIERCALLFQCQGE